jgi:hypothetical protein
MGHMISPNHLLSVELIIVKTHHIEAVIVIHASVGFAFGRISCSISYYGIFYLEGECGDKVDSQS